MKAAVSATTQVSSTLPTNVNLPRVPVSILQRRLTPAGGGSVEYGLVEWSG